LVFLTTDLGRAQGFSGRVQQPAPGPCTSKEGNNVKKYALAAALALTLSGAAQATAIDLTAPLEVVQAPGRIQWVAPRTSELPEPAVFAMMLVGLVLIGYRASRDSSEKFK
jgi:hypothetical protein